MASDSRGKRKSPCPDIGSSNTLNGAEGGENDFQEPEKKIQRLNEPLSKPNLEIPIIIESEKTAEIVEVLGTNEYDRQDLTIPGNCEVTQDKTENLTDSIENGVEALETPEIKQSSTDLTASIENGVEAVETTEPDNVKVDQTEPIPMDCESETETDSLEPLIKISFRDQVVANNYRDKFLKFLSNFVELELLSQTELTINMKQDNSLNPSEWVVLDGTLCSENYDIQSDKSFKSRNKKKKKRDSKDMLFVVDTSPSLNTNKQELKYSSKFVIGEKSEDKGKKIACFNCDQDHSIRDCPLPKDMAKIKAAREQFGSVKKSTRYHLEEDQKYGHLKPGQLSDNLRKALGLRKLEIPPFVYRMRMLGYPPGWLEEAKAVNSNLALFDIHGNHVHTKQKVNKGLDPDKVIDYIGFNVPPEKGSKDCYREYGAPPYSEQFSKEAMIDYFEKMSAMQEDDLEPCDMALDTESNNDSVQEKKEELNSDSLTELEMKKKQLLEELESGLETSYEAEDKSVLNESICSLRNTSFGTPILKSTSPFARLPNSDNFSKDVSPIIYFENLPNSTGKYDQMTGVLQKVRNTLKHLQNCS